QRLVQRLIESFASSSDGLLNDASASFEEQLELQQGKGNQLPGDAQAFLESRLGIDLSAVRVHTGEHADSLAKSVQATAFTTGSDMFFRDGAFHPGSDEGMKLLAHEATHVVQQSNEPVPGTPSQDGSVSVSDPSDHMEREAEHVADEVMIG